MPSPLAISLHLARIYRCRWPLLRLIVAVVLLWFLIVDNPARLTRLQMASLPDYDHAGEARSLFYDGRYSEALMVVDAGLMQAGGERAATLRVLRDEIISERDSWMRRLRAAGIGAVTGEGDSIEALAGAITADLFIVGDIRDLTIQGGRLVLDGKADPVIAGLSAAGLVLTVAPHFDAGAAILKAARRSGSMTRRFAESLATQTRAVVERGQVEGLMKISTDMRVLADSVTAPGAIRLMKHIDDPAELARVSDFLRRHPEAGGFALHATGPDGIDLLLRSGRIADDALLTAAKKGPRGIRLLKSIDPRLLRPHPILALIKTAYKGTLPRFLERFVADFLDPYTWLLIPTLGVWLLFEIHLITKRLAPRSPLISNS